MARGASRVKPNVTCGYETARLGDLGLFWPVAFTTKVPTLKA